MTDPVKLTVSSHRDRARLLRDPQVKRERQFQVSGFRCEHTDEICAKSSATANRQIAKNRASDTGAGTAQGSRRVQRHTLIPPHSSFRMNLTISIENPNRCISAAAQKHHAAMQ